MIGDSSSRISRSRRRSGIGSSSCSSGGGDSDTIGSVGDVVVVMVVHFMHHAVEFEHAWYDVKHARSPFLPSASGGAGPLRCVFRQWHGT